MSVINRMLRDLDQRQQRASSQTYTPAALSPQPIHRGWIIGILVLAIIVVIGGLKLWFSFNDQSTEPAVTQVTTETPAASDTALSELEKAAQAIQGVQQQVAEPSTDAVPAPVSSRKQEAIVDVSQLPTSTAEIEAIAEPKQATSQAPEPEAKAGAEPVAEPTSVVASEPAQVSVTQSPAKETGGSLEVTRVQLSPEELAETNLAKAREALQKGEQARGQELLEKALMVKPDHVAVRSELAAYWYGRGLATRALTLLQQGLDMQPRQSQWQLLFARILDRMGRVEQAYTALLSIREDAPEALELLELRASAANTLGYFAEAAADYTVLATQSNQGRWWLAAALAYEDADNIEAAIRSYQQAQQYRDLNADARDYIAQRLLVLEGY